MDAVRTWPDRLIGRLLFVDTQSPAAERPASAARAEQAFGFSLLVSGVRCILQYVVLPFILPLIGIAAEVAVPITLAINLVAVVLILFSLRRFWQINYRHKWQYLFVAVTAWALLGAFIALDLKALL
ncbi:MAG: hypothetical protein LCI00_24190 [Chloroflexi bacterium]|nr:hypothetical protein [Chloroflexota bacterium]MCC6895872.1 hypothetical protein [Anaerolineae bacterium]